MGASWQTSDQENENAELHNCGIAPIEERNVCLEDVYEALLTGKQFTLRKNTSNACLIALPAALPTARTWTGCIRAVDKGHCFASMWGQQDKKRRAFRSDALVAFRRAWAARSKLTGWRGRKLAPLEAVQPKHRSYPFSVESVESVTCPSARLVRQVIRLIFFSFSEIPLGHLSQKNYRGNESGVWRPEARKRFCIWTTTRKKSATRRRI